jgi:epsin
MLKSFHYIDSKGVDQGINIRNRAKELTNLLNDESKIRQERRKAKENSKKFDAISSTSVGTRNLHAATNRSRRAGAGSSSRHVATDDDGYENRIFGDGGVYGQRFEEPRTNVASPNEFEEYHEDTAPETTATTATNHRASKPTTQTTTAPARAAPVDLFDDFTSAPAPAAAAAATEDFDDDEFDDFQSATPAITTTTTASNGNGNLSDLLSSSYGPRTPAASTAAPTPVISQPVKSDDIFGSLLMSAKQTSHTVPTRTSAPAPARSIPTATRTASSTASAPVPSKNTDIIDLLDL